MDDKEIKDMSYGYVSYRFFFIYLIAVYFFSRETYFILVLKLTAKLQGKEDRHRLHTVSLSPEETRSEQLSSGGSFKLPLVSSTHFSLT